MSDKFNMITTNTHFLLVHKNSRVFNQKEDWFYLWLLQDKLATMMMCKTRRKIGNMD